MDHSKSAGHYDVVVVGAGPVGLAAALLLARDNVRVAVVDPMPIVCPHPRATHIDDETMRILQTLGVADFEPTFLKQTGWELFADDGTCFIRFALRKTVTDQGWYADYQTHQPDIESALRGFIDAAGGDLVLGWWVDSLDQGEHGVRLGMHSLDGSQTMQLSADYVIGADGASSFVRRHLGMEVEDLHGTQTSLIVDVHPFEHPETLAKDVGFVRCEPELPVTYCPIGPPRLRFEFMLGKQHDVEEMSKAHTVYKLLSRWMEPGTYRIMRTDIYEWRAGLVHGWRKGRVLLAGDAAHTMPPMLGQGMCSGLRDSMNLAWKLSRVVKGTAAENLLDTYGSERSVNVKPYIVESSRQSNMIEDFGYNGTPEPVSEPQAVENSPRYPLGPGLVDNPEGQIGVLAPQPLDAEGNRLDDKSGYHFTIVGEPRVVSGVSGVTRGLWKELDAVDLGAGGTPIRTWLSDNNARAAIIRPDRYVYAFVESANELDLVTMILSRKVLTDEVPA